MNLPNLISTIRICMVPIITAVFFILFPYNYVVVAALFIIAASTDFIDGMIARKKNLVTDLGKFLDPLADKLLVCTLLVLMCTKGSYFMWEIPFAVCSIIIISREIIISGFRQIAATKGIVMAADKLGKFKTIFQDIAIPFLLVAPTLLDTGVNFFTVIQPYIMYTGYGLMILATVLTIWSGISYIVKNRQVLKTEKKQEKEEEI